MLNCDSAMISLQFTSKETRRNNWTDTDSSMSRNRNSLGEEGKERESEREKSPEDENCSTRSGFCWNYNINSKWRMAKNNSTITNSLRKDRRNAPRLEKLSHLKCLQRRKMRDSNDCRLRGVLDRLNHRLIAEGAQLNNLIFSYEYQDSTIYTVSTLTKRTAKTKTPHTPHYTIDPID